jgi:hypothetical protein
MGRGGGGTSPLSLTHTALVLQFLRFNSQVNPTIIMSYTINNAVA